MSCVILFSFWLLAFSCLLIAFSYFKGAKILTKEEQKFLRDNFIKRLKETAAKRPLSIDTLAEADAMSATLASARGQAANKVKNLLFQEYKRTPKFYDYKGLKFDKRKDCICWKFFPKQIGE